MQNRQYPNIWYLQCAQQLGLPYDAIEECSEGSEGEELLHDNGLLTKSLHPPMVFDPLVIFNGVGV